MAHYMLHVGPDGGKVEPGWVPGVRRYAVCGMRCFCSAGIYERRVLVGYSGRGTDGGREGVRAMGRARQARECGMRQEVRGREGDG